MRARCFIRLPAGEVKQEAPRERPEGRVETGREEDPTVGEVKLEGRFVKLSGDYALSKNAKGTIYCREV